MDRALDDIISDRYRGRDRHNNRGNQSRRNDRGGISKGGFNRDRRNQGGRGTFNNNRKRPQLTNMIKISNLHYELSEDDIHELLSRIGPVRQVRLQYDNSGRSDGVAYANFTNSEDATEAVKRYNGKRAAGLEIVVQALDQSGSLRSRLNVFDRGEDDTGNTSYRNDRNNGRGNYGRNNGNDGENRRNERESRPRKSVEELDAELNEYMSGRANNNESTGNDADENIVE